MSGAVDSFFQRLWYGEELRWLSWLLLPLAGLFRLLVWLRRAMYRVGLQSSRRVERPVIVVGNLSVGGTGKTPLTIWLAEALRARGLRVGIVLRGYGGRSTRWPREVDSGSDWEAVGDEAVLLASRTEAIVVAGPDRVAAAERAIEAGAQIVLSDDGLQHYRLARDLELAVIDARRGLGNGRMLPAGPLREPRRRLSQVDLIVLTHRGGRRNGEAAADPAPCEGWDGPRPIHAAARLGEALCIATGERRALQSFRGAPVHAVAGIGHPQAFFDALSELELDVRPHALADHAALSRADICFADEAPVLMTEKDAVKCRGIADRRHWVVPMQLELSVQDVHRVSVLLDRLLGAGSAG